MEKKPRIVSIRLTPIICFLLLTLLYVDFYGSNIVPFYRRAERVSNWQLSSTRNAETSQVQKSRPLSIRSSGANGILQEFDSGEEISSESSKSNETTKVQDFDGTVQEHESRQVSHSSRAFNETVQVQEPRSPSFASRETKETRQEQESIQVYQISRESIGTIGTEEAKSGQPINTSRELSVSGNPARQGADQISFSNEQLNGGVELQKAAKYTGDVNEKRGGPESRQLNPINRDKKETTKEHDSEESLFTRLVKEEDRTKLEATGFACDTSFFSLVCVTEKTVTIDMATMSLHIPADQNVEPSHKVVRPYARQEDEDVLRYVRPVQIFHGNTTPPVCQCSHDFPAVIFSSSGFTGNLFHEFNEIIIPLFITTYHFKSRVQFILVDYKPTFRNRYRRLMSRLSSYEVINPAKNPSVHCFSGAVAGLKFHDHLTLNSSEIPGGYTMHSFRKFLTQTYSLKIINVSEIKRPKLMLISRRGTRRFLNEAEMVRMMKDLGFEVIVAKKPNRMSNLDKFARVVNSCSVLVGTHGAGLANELFLPDGAVMVQIEPLGLDWASAFYFGNPAKAMGLHYLRYKIEAEESSLLDTYRRNHPVIKDPASIFAQGYQAARAVYIDQQNMKINLDRLKETLLEALRLTGFSSPQTQ